MPLFRGDHTQELHAERALLVKADRDIEEGNRRVRQQQTVVMGLRDGGHDARLAERLLELFRQSLVEWEHHRVLIAQRVTYLENLSQPIVSREA